MINLQRNIVNRTAYLALVERVATVDLEAAEYLLYQAPTEIHRFNYTDRLGGSFVWANSKQGHEYWSKINSKLVSSN